MVAKCACGLYTAESIQACNGGEWLDVPFCSRCRNRERERERARLEAIARVIEEVFG